MDLKLNIYNNSLEFLLVKIIYTANKPITTQETLLYELYVNSEMGVYHFNSRNNKRIKAKLNLTRGYFSRTIKQLEDKMYIKKDGNIVLLHPSLKRGNLTSITFQKKSTTTDDTK